MKKITAFVALVLFSATSLIARQGRVEMADALRQSGKIYVVVSVIAVVFLGIAAWLFSLDRRLKKIERRK